jgi:hypothetical protein
MAARDDHVSSPAGALFRPAGQSACNNG